MAITAITSVQEFDEKVLGSKGLAIVDFWAAWCEPCSCYASRGRSSGRTLRRASRIL